MEKQIIKDSSGLRISVLIGYWDWLEIEHTLESSKAIQSKGDNPDNPLDWYTLTETTNSILNEVNLPSPSWRG